MKPFDLFDPARKGRIKLYVRRVFIADDIDIVNTHATSTPQGVPGIRKRPPGGHRVGQRTTVGVVRLEPQGIADPVHDPAEHEVESAGPRLSDAGRHAAGCEENIPFHWGQCH